MAASQPTQTHCSEQKNPHVRELVRRVFAVAAREQRQPPQSTARVLADMQLDERVRATGEW